MGLDALALVHRRLLLSMTLCGKPEFLKLFRVELVEDGLGLFDKTHGLGIRQIGLVHMFIILLIIGQFLKPETIIVDISINLVRVREPLPACEPSSPRKPASIPTPGRRSWLAR